MSTVDGSTWRVRNERSLDYATGKGALINNEETHVILAAGSATAEDCGRACIAYHDSSWTSGCKSFSWNPTTSACHVSEQLEDDFAVDTASINCHVDTANNKEYCNYRAQMQVVPEATYYELIYLHQAPAPTELVCRHAAQWSAYPGIVATCKSHLYWQDCKCVFNPRVFQSPRDWNKRMGMKLVIVEAGQVVPDSSAHLVPDVPKETDCVVLCLRDPACVSAEYGKEASDAATYRTCILSTAREGTAGAELRPDAKFDYFESIGFHALPSEDKKVCTHDAALKDN